MIIDQLPLMSGNPQDDDEFPIERGTTTYKTKLQALAAGIFGKIASSATPLMDGTASPGTGTSAARADHRHPTDTTRAAAAELATYVRPNLLDNWYFVGGGSQLGYGTFPINQRGQTSYQTIGYSFDRWYINNAFTMELQSGGLRLSSTSVATIQQTMSAVSLRDKKLTASALCSSLTGSFHVNIRINGTVKFVSADITSAGITSISFNVPEDANTITFEPRLDASTSVVITAAKLELGSTQTLAHQEGSTWVLNEVPDYATELAKCQAYLLPISALSRTRTNIVLDNVLGFDVPVPVTMAKTPAIVGTLRVSTLTGSFVTGFTFDVSGISDNAVRIRASKTSHGLTDGFIDSDAVWYLSAE